MKRTMIVTAAALCLLSGTPAFLHPPAEAAALVGQCDNAAVAYLHASELIRSSGHSTQLQSTDWGPIEGKTTWEEMSEEFKAAFALVPQQAIRAFLKGSQMPCCEFYIAREEGINAMLPHLGYMRAVARVVRLDARGQLAQGNVEAAAERVAAMLRLSTQIGRDQPLISSLVGMAIAAIAHQEADVILMSGRDTPEARRILQAAVDTFNDDPFHFRAAIRGEQEWTLGWMGREFTGKDAGRRLVAALGDGWLQGGTPDAVAHGLALLDEAGLRREISLLQGYYAEVQRLWDDPEAVAKLEQLEQRFSGGEFGLLSPFAAAFSKAKSSEERAKATLERTRELLAGEPGR
jgi:hypothetical protein